MILHAASENTENTAEAFGRYFCATVQMFCFLQPSQCSDPRKICNRYL